MPLCPLWAHSPLDFKDCLHEWRVALLQTAAVPMHCCCSHPQIVAHHNIPGLHVGPALPHNTSPHTPKPEKEECRNLSPQLGLLQIQVHVYTASPGSMETPALTLEGSSREVPNPVRLISLNNTDLGENGRNMPNLTCDCTFCYAQSRGEEVASRFLQAPWCWKLEPCFFLGKAGRGCSAWHTLPFAYKKLSSHHLDIKYSLPCPTPEAFAQQRSQIHRRTSSSAVVTVFIYCYSGSLASQS